MKIVNLDQKSSQWHEWRSKRITASDMAAVLGRNPYRSKYDVWLEKIGLGKPFVTNHHVERGVRCEPVARRLLSERVGVTFEPCCVENTKYPWLGASLDGISEGVALDITPPSKWICELKASEEKTHKLVLHGIMVEYYVIQCQTQLLLTEADLCLFANYCESYDGEKLAVIEVRPDKVWQEIIIHESKKFWDDNVLGFKPPELAAGDWIERTDDEFERKISLWKLAKEKKNFADDLEEDLRKQVIAMTGGKNTAGFGVKVNHFPRKGNMDYNHPDITSRLQGLDLEKYRKQTITVSTIRCEEKHVNPKPINLSPDISISNSAGKVIDIGPFLRSN